MRAVIEIRETEDIEHPFENIVGIFGYEDYGLKLQDVIELAKDNSGDLSWRKGFAKFHFSCKKSGRDCIEVDDFITNLGRTIRRIVQCRTIQKSKKEAI